MKWPLHFKILAGLLLGVAWAFISSWLGFSDFTNNWIAPFGTIFINLLKLIAVPLIFFSIICGITGLTDLSVLGKLGFRTLFIYLITTIFAISTGLILVNMFQPGKQIDEASRIDNRIVYELWVLNVGKSKNDSKCFICDEKYADRVEVVKRNENLKESDEFVTSKVEQANKTKSLSPLQPLVDMIPSNIMFSLSDNGLMLQVIFFAIFFGICILLVGINNAKPVIDFCNSANLIFLKMVDVVMLAAPFFVFALLAGVVAKMAGNDVYKIVEIFKGLLSYSLVVIAGLFFMVFVFYPMLIHFFAKGLTFKNFLKGMAPAQLLAFSTSSSAATLPVTIECVEENLKVKKEISSFVLPIGATVNMDGTSLYQAVAVVFLAQLHLVDLNFAQQLTIVLAATLASIGSAAVPSAGLVMLIIVLESVGLNPAWIAIIFPVDRILDMCRTVVNVTGDGAVAAIMNSWVSKDK